MLLRYRSTIQQLQGAFKSPYIDKAATRDLLKQVVDQNLWAEARNGDRKTFDSCAEWAISPSPHGLGICNQETAEFLRDMLLENGDVVIWAEILSEITRSQGNPGLTPDPLKFYRVTTAGTAIDRMLLRLMRQKPEFYNMLCDGEFGTIREAAVAAGIVGKQHAPADLNAVLKIFRQLDEEQKLFLVVSLVEQLEQPSVTKLAQRFQFQT